MTFENETRWKISANALVESPDGLLLVNPTYKNGWDLPGGIVELGESPVDGLKREIFEELNVPISVEELRYVDYIQSDWENRPVIMFIFGVSLEITEIEMDRCELSDWCIAPRESALEMVSRNMCSRLRNIWTHRQWYGESLK